MNVKGLSLVLITVLHVVRVRSECDDYITCLGSFLGDFFYEKDKPPALDSVIAQNTESQELNLDAKELDQILQDVSSFIKEELELQTDMDLNSMLFRQIHNRTAIYVKTFDISEDYLKNASGNENEGPILKFTDQVDIKSGSADPGVLNISNNESTINKIIKEIMRVTPVPVNYVENKFIENVLTTTSARSISLSKDEHENEVETNDDSYLFYESDEDNATDYPILDYVALYKDTTNEYVNLDTTGVPNVIEDNIKNVTNSLLRNTIINSTPENRTKGYARSIDEELSNVIFPWIAAIFIKNSSSDQFDYYCDGALLSQRTVLTAARCVQNNNSTVKPENLLVLFGKKSLKMMKDGEKIARVNDIKVHGNFSTKDLGHDIALLIVQEPVIFSDNIQAAALGSGDIDAEQDQATTGWAITGEITPIALNTTAKIVCGQGSTQIDTFCAVYGNEITVCPSYGGLYVTKREAWHLQGLRTGDPEDRGLCFNKNIAFTSLNSHLEWIKTPAAVVPVPQLGSNPVASVQ